MVFSVRTWMRAFRLLMVTAIAAGGIDTVSAQGIVPGTGQKWEGVGDDFEDESWEFLLNLPKSSKNIDQVVRGPSGYSTNDRMLESTYRGTPDIVRRVETPPGGLPGSKGALLLQTRESGIPGQLSYKMQQDDLIVNVAGRIGGHITPDRQPSVVVRVYAPPFDEWEERTGSHFGFRIEASGWGVGEVEKKTGFLNRKTVKVRDRKYENYWPGFFFQFNRKEDSGAAQDSAVLVIRCDDNGQDFLGPAITPGWWTLGMSVTAEGRVHYYARQGVENLRPQDHLASTFPYGSKADKFNTFFFNSVNMDDGKSWSTKFIIDDPTLYIVR